MLALTSVDLTSILGHGIHYAIVAAGLLGLIALLAPQFVPGGRIPARVGPADDHTRRVAALRRSLVDGPAAQRPLGAPATRTTPAPVDLRLPRARADRPLALPMALVSSASAAGIHAAVGPTHFEEGLLIGSFFAVSALAQLGWAAAVLLAPTRRLLLLGALGNLAIVALWTLTRTVGLPLGLMTGTEAAGPWDLAATGWELLTAGICVALLAGPRLLAPDRGVHRWHPAARWWLLASLAVIVLLPFVGAGEA